MNFTEPIDAQAAVQRLRNEIERLTEEQAEALKTATFVGMTPDEAKTYDTRRKTITRLTQELGSLQELQAKIPQ